jgi:pyruvate, water dikinase
MKPLPLTEQLEECLVGGKAASLAAATRAGLPVPVGVALPFGFVDAIAAGDAEARQQLAAIFRTLGAPVVARSSAVGEDSEQATFAGQYLTRLNLRSEPQLVDAVLAIWDSARSPSAFVYRQRLRLPREPRMGVVVQELIDADTAGVLFSRNPITGSDELVVEAAWGLGESVVAGLVTPDRFRLRRDGAVVERIAGLKDVAVCIDPEGGTRERKVPTRSHTCSASTTVSSPHYTHSPCAATRSSQGATISNGRSPAIGSTCCSGERSQQSQIQLRLPIEQAPVNGRCDSTPGPWAR